MDLFNLALFLIKKKQGNYPHLLLDKDIPIRNLERIFEKLLGLNLFLDLILSFIKLEFLGNGMEQ